MHSVPMLKQRFRPYLLVDVRDADQFDQCHIITAHSYPAQNFSRTMNPFSPEMYDFKNVDGKIIILYDVDEFLATHCAHQMVQRGFENIFVVSIQIFLFTFSVYYLYFCLAIRGFAIDSPKNIHGSHNRFLSRGMLFIT